MSNGGTRRPKQAPVGDHSSREVEEEGIPDTKTVIFSELKIQVLRGHSGEVVRSYLRGREHPPSKRTYESKTLGPKT